ncbi:hypothetical protein FRB99_007668 [Tulasnella sp. 403]|nr:hypothetical protein FRB99_007668 [Tulasnella sp. 403]
MKPLRNVLKKGGKYDDNDQFVQAEVDGANRVVKVFRGKIGEKAFLNALDFLQTHNILDKHPNYGHTIQIWECLIDMKEALEFIARRNPDLVQNLKGDTERVGYIQRILEGGMVDESGAVTMDIPDTSAIEQRGTGFWGPSWRMMNSKFNAAHFMANSGVHRLLELPSCRQLSLALDDQPESVLDRTVFEAARQNPYEGILSLREFRERQSTRFPWTTSWLDARLCDIGLFDRKRAAVTKQGEFRKISEMDEIAVSWQIRQPFIETFEVTEVSDGVYRFTFATQPWTSEIQWMTRIEWSTDLARTDDDMLEEIFFDAPLASEAVTAEKGVIDAMDVPQMEL